MNFNAAAFARDLTNDYAAQEWIRNRIKRHIRNRRIIKCAIGAVVAVILWLFAEAI